MRNHRFTDPPECHTCAKKDNPLLCVLHTPELQSLSEQKTYNFYKKGQLIFHEGNRPQGLYCIDNGKVKIHKLGEEGKEQIVRFAKEGQVLGYRSLLSNEPYNASATALEDTMICFISKTAFMELLEKNPTLSYQAILMLTNDLKTAEQKIMNMAQKSVRSRVAEAVFLLKECYGTESDNQTINSTLTRRDISNIAGTTTETTIRVLSDLKSENVVELPGKKIKILKEQELIRIANIVD
jgi:CRP/FNR family transcriptional regulator, polysaccharide utilization system transcription regulator